MAKIQNQSVWYQGEMHQANIFSLYSDGDNLIDLANFQYQLIEEIIVSPEESKSQTLIIGRLTISGADYAQWDAEIDANAWIYQWAADQLNLVLLPESSILIPQTITNESETSIGSN
jgi:hypothetical protein